MDFSSGCFRTAGVVCRGEVRDIPRQWTGWFGREEGLGSGDTSIAKRVDVYKRQEANLFKIWSKKVWRGSQMVQ